MVAARNEVKEPRLREPEGLPLYRLPLRQCAPFNGESSHQGDGDTDGRIQTRPVVPEAVPLGQGCSNYAPPSVSSPSDRSVLRHVISSRGYQPYIPVAGSGTGDTAQHSSQGQSDTATGSEAVASQTGDPSGLLPDDTTVMLSNLPPQYISMENLMEAFAESGFSGTYDLIYIPPRQKAKRVKSNTGFCFVNFTKPMHAAEFASKAEAFISDKVEKSVSVTRAQLQGFANNMRKHADQNGKLADETCLRAFSA